MVLAIPLTDVFVTCGFDTAVALAAPEIHGQRNVSVGGEWVLTEERHFLQIALQMETALVLTTISPPSPIVPNIYVV